MEVRTFQDELNEHLRRFGNRTAIEYANRCITYGELDKNATIIAHWVVVEQGIGKETFIGILVDDRIGFTAVMIGLLKAGCVFVPLDAAYPDSRLEQMMDITHLDIIFIDENNYRKYSTRDFMKNRNIEFIVIENLLKHQNETGILNPPEVRYSLEDKIYAYFTSGTTGLPRAVVGKNKSLLNYIQWEVNAFGIDKNFRLNQFAPLGFDASLKEIFVTFFSGGTLCIPESLNEILYPEAIIDWFEKYKINLIHCIPHIFRILNSGKLTGERLPNFKYLVLAGEEIHPSDLKTWYEKMGERIQLVNLYGTTETTILNTCYFINKSDVHRDRIPVGKPIKGNRVVILDENMKICPRNIIGEIFIRTPFRTFGYYNNDESNREKFFRNPLSDNPGDLLFRTGDLGRLLPDGNIEFLGRMDRQVKIRGNRVELGEIENILISHPVVKEAAAIKKELPNQGELLLAYFKEDEENGTGSEYEYAVSLLKEYLAEKLPSYMVPAHIIKLEEIPRTPNRKVDYNRLPDPSQDEEKDHVSPANGIEETLVEFWREILGIEKIGVTDNFFELGGSSLNIMSLTHKIHSQFDKRITLAEMFNNPTIRQQATLIGSSELVRYTSLDQAEEKEYYPLSSAQKRLYFIKQMDTRSTAYNISRIAVLDSELDIKRLEKAFRELIQRHESIRTSFLVIGDEPVQKIHNELDFEIEYHALPGTQVENEVKVEGGSSHPPHSPYLPRHFIKSFIRPFDLSRAPLLRVGLIEVNSGANHILMVDMNHIISDGVSSSILVKEFLQLYRGETLPPLRIQYKDYAEWQDKFNRSPWMEQQEAYWLKRFEGEIPFLRLPVDWPEYRPQNPGGRKLKFEIDRALTGKVSQVLLETETTLYMVLFAVYNILLSKCSGQDDIVIGSPAAGRPAADLKDVVGMFVNMLAMRNLPGRNKPFIDFLMEVKENALNAYENQDYPFDRLIKNLNLQRTAGADSNPLINTVFTMQNTMTVDRSNPEDVALELKLKIHVYEEKAPMFDLTLDAVEIDGSIDMYFTYSTALFKPSTIEKLKKYYLEILEQAVEDIRIKIGDISLGSDVTAAASGILQTESDGFDF